MSRRPILVLAALAAFPAVVWAATSTTQFSFLTSTPGDGAWADLASITLSVPAGGVVQVHAHGTAQRNLSNCTMRVGLGASSGSSGPAYYVSSRSAVSMLSSGFASNTSYAGYADATGTGTFTLGYEFTPTANLVVNGVYNNYGTGSVRIWHAAEQIQLLAVNNPRAGTFGAAIASNPVVLKSFVKYIVTIDVNNSTYAFDNTPYGSQFAQLMTLGPGRYTSSVGAFPMNTSPNGRFGGVGLSYYRLASNLTENEPVAVSHVFSVAAAGSYTFFLKGLRLENQSPDGTCTFSVSGMNAIFHP